MVEAVIGDVRYLRVRKTTRLRPGFEPQGCLALVLDCTRRSSYRRACWHLLVSVPRERAQRRPGEPRSRSRMSLITNLVKR